MEPISKLEFIKEYELYPDRFKDGALFIYPTDTIYGIGCNAMNSKSVKKIRDLKNRPNLPFSIIAPSKEWIKENCIITPDAEKWLDRLPGPYTFIFRLKNKESISPVTNDSMETIGVRIPDHWISGFAQMLDFPIVTTSVNKTGDDFMTSLDDLDNDISSEVDYIVYEGERKARPSTLIRFDIDEIEIKER